LGRSHASDPASALLELLDPEQNANFLDTILLTWKNKGRCSNKKIAVEKVMNDESNIAEYVAKPVFRAEKIYEPTPGHLGDVMKESTQIAHTVARKILLEKEPANLFFANSKLHLHVPAGATPKDGPSAGCTMITSLP
uniref:Lon proteolytic domain-containing protein n=3 Tax=Brassica TaxID=3705 RepID=A0A0D3E169_BRAOL